MRVNQRPWARCLLARRNPEGLFVSAQLETRFWLGGFGSNQLGIAANYGGENSVAEEVQAFYEKVLEELKSEDTSSLERIYADDYILVRPNGDTFTKEQILADLRHHSMSFTSSFDVNGVLIRTKGSVAILTAYVRSIAVRDGVEIRTYAGQLAILSKENERITISHFQSTNVVDC
jgi:ketosteroid isomerase-like protein